MNKKINSDIVDFMQRVGGYIAMEYDDRYYVYYSAFNTQLFDFVGSYYLGGNNVPDTARYVVELINMNGRNNV